MIRRRGSPSSSAMMRHDVAVAQHLTPADVKNTTDGFRRRQDASQVCEHILDGDGLAARGDPLWSDHDRQAVDEIAKNLERRRARTNDHSRAQDRDRHSCRPERRLHVPARREMFTEAGPVSPRPPRYMMRRTPASSAAFANARARSRSRCAYSRSGRHHRVHQIVCRVTSGEFLRERW